MAILLSQDLVRQPPVRIIWRLMQRYLICRYNEITLKGHNRRSFEIALRENLKRALKGISNHSVFRLSGRVAVRLGADADVEEALGRSLNVFGIATCSPAWGSQQDIKGLQQDLWKLVQGRTFESFKIEARRTPHSIDLPTPEINRQVGAYLQHKCGKEVRLEDPDLTCFLEFVEDYAFIYFRKERGAGGLPARTAGKAVGLLSGGIDSPVAAYRMMRRGCRVIFVHFHSFPHTTLEAQEKVRRLVGVLNRYQGHSQLFMIPFAQCQRRIVAASPASARVVLYRRMMLRLAERVAWRKRARVLLTGESLGQVASQTLENLTVIDSASKRPVLRPLVGFDKQEIVDQARRIGTYEISIEPEEDCCTLFIPDHPQTRAKYRRIREIESGLDIEAMVEEAQAEAQVETF
ncbi:MAG TPA: tRNA uracil 4-sulfurtransferase ThiI [Acidobacteriota bacterium]|nr:tRNA uracil 4-sulfurtransferase ThiI [Acidobacteriota bacterium]